MIWLIWLILSGAGLSLVQTWAVPCVKNVNATVDRTNPTPGPHLSGLFTGFCTSPAVQDFFHQHHQQYVSVCALRKQTLDEFAKLTASRCSCFASADFVANEVNEVLLNAPRRHRQAEVNPCIFCSWNYMVRPPCETVKFDFHWLAKEVERTFGGQDVWSEGWQHQEAWRGSGHTAAVGADVAGEQEPYIVSSWRDLES